MWNIPVIRWGKPYESLEKKTLSDFRTGEPLAQVDQAADGMVRRDMRNASAARAALRQIAPGDLIDRLKRAGELYLQADLPLGNGRQSPHDFVRAQAATTGLPEVLCRNNMQKNQFVLSQMGTILDALTRGLDLNILSRGYGMESRSVMVSYQAQSPILGAVLPSNSPGVHTLWLPVIALQLGLVLKPGSQEPWTPYRIMSAMVEAGIPAEAFSMYPGGHDVGGALLNSCRRSMIFGGAATVQQYAGNPGVQVHGPGFTKIVFGEDTVDRWEDYLDLMVESVCSNGGRSCINCSSIWAPRHADKIADAIAARIGTIEVRDIEDPQAELAAFVDPAMAEGVWGMLQAVIQRPEVRHATESYGDRFVRLPHAAYLRPVVMHCQDPGSEAAQQEFMFPCVTVVNCPQAELLKRLGSTLVCTAITDDNHLIASLSDATEIDRLNIGAIPTNRLNWLQPHEGNLIEFLFRSRAYQRA
ncbi:MAG: aldehyde dehydrogenase family protein [Planctomycetota bacterium]|nr:aldehyde dehydrogenase family protein [Planctomycetota bacterium]